MNRVLSVIEDILNNGIHNAVVVTHGNLMSLLLMYYDNTFGFEEWERLSNPDIYHIQFDGVSTSVQRIWID